MTAPSRIRKLPGLTSDAVAMTLADLATQVPARQAVVEVGVYQARTTLFLAWGARQGHGAHVWGVDPWDLSGPRDPRSEGPVTVQGRPGKSFTDPGTRAWGRHHVRATGYVDRVTLLRGFSTEVAAGWDGPPIGLLFVDGDRRAVVNDVRAWAPHLAEHAVIAFGAYDQDHLDVVRAVDELVAEGVVWPVQVYHDQLAVARVAGVREIDQAQILSATPEGAAVALPPVLPDGLQIERGGIRFHHSPGAEEGWFAVALPPAVEGDSTEREHPGTGEVMEGVEAAPDGTENVLTVTEVEADQQAELARAEIYQDALHRGLSDYEARETAYPAPDAWPNPDTGKIETVPPVEGRPVQPAGKARTVPAAADYHPVDDANLPLSKWAVPGELGLERAVRLERLNIGQLKALAKERGVVLGRDGKVKPIALAKLREAAQ